jgi:hypothetical protein
MPRRKARVADWCQKVLTPLAILEVITLTCSTQ